MRTTVVLMTLMFTSAAARAEIAPVNRELASKVLDIAAKAKSQHPTSPADAMSRFVADFNGEFGDISPVDNRLIERPDLAVTFLTPIQLLRSSVALPLTHTP